MPRRRLIHSKQPASGATCAKSAERKSASRHHALSPILFDHARALKMNPVTMGMRGWGNGYNDSLVLLFVVELLFESFKPSFEVGVLSVAFAGIGLEVVDLFLLGFDCFHDDGDDANIIDRLTALLISEHKIGENCFDSLSEEAELVSFAETHAGNMLPVEHDAAHGENVLQRVW